MVDANDPLTGEKVQASINEWGAVLDIASQGTEDLLRWINGEISNEQIANGQYMQRLGHGEQARHGQYAPKVLSTQEIQSRLNSIDTVDRASSTASRAGQTLPRAGRSQASRRRTSRTALGPSLDAQLRGDAPGAHRLARGRRSSSRPTCSRRPASTRSQPFAGDPTTLDAWPRRSAA